jgi:hypothetical protein
MLLSGLPLYPKCPIMALSQHGLLFCLAQSALYQLSLFLGTDTMPDT